MITDYNTLSGLDKIAIIFTILGESLAIKLIKGLPETDIKKIRTRIREMGAVSTAVRKQVVDEFYLSFLSKKFSEEDGDSQRPFQFLEGMPDERLLALLEVEEPRIIALALAQVSADQRRFVLDRLPREVTGRVLIEMGVLHEIPLEGVVSIAAQLEEKSHFLPRGVDFSRGGGKDIAEVLSSMSMEEEEKYLEAIGRESPELLKEIKKYHLSFEDIFQFPDTLLRDLMNSVELDTIAMAMKGLDQATVDRVIENLPQKKQAMYEPVEGAVAKREIDAARKNIVTAARQMEEDGRFSLEDILGGGEMVE
ncbi:MAG: FliG C-terminal domain-containing protein [Fidelibacterota bacterium]